MTIVRSPFLRRCAALSLLLVLAVVIWGACIHPVLSSWEETSRSNQRGERLLLAYREMIHDKPEWETLASQMRDPKYAQMLVRGGDANLAAARFQTDIKEDIEGAGGTVQSIQLLPPAKDHDLQRLITRVNFVLPLEQVPGLLERMETRTPYVFADQFAITAPESNPESKPKPVELTIRGDFYMYFQPETL